MSCVGMTSVLSLPAPQRDGMGLASLSLLLYSLSFPLRSFGRGPRLGPAPLLAVSRHWTFYLPEPCIRAFWDQWGQLEPSL